MDDSLEPDRLLVGADVAQGFDAMRRLYEPLLGRGVRLIETDIPTAELAKHASNAFLALKISYANALARICELAGAPTSTAVADVMGSDPRIGQAFLDAGLGYGGYCFPKDVAAFERLADHLGYAFPLLAGGGSDERGGRGRRRGRCATRCGTSRTSGSRCSGSPSSPAPMTSASPPRWHSRAGSSTTGPRWSDTTPTPRANAKAELPEVSDRDRPVSRRARGRSHCVVLCATAWTEFRTLDLARAKHLMAASGPRRRTERPRPGAVAGAGFIYLPVGTAGRSTQGPL